MKKNVLIFLLSICLLLTFVACEPDHDLGNGPDTTVADTDDEGENDITESDTNDENADGESQETTAGDIDIKDEDDDGGESQETTAGGIDIKDEDDDDGEWGALTPLTPAG